MAVYNPIEEPAECVEEFGALRRLLREIHSHYGESEIALA